MVWRNNPAAHSKWTQMKKSTIYILAGVVVAIAGSIFFRQHMAPDTRISLDINLPEFTPAQTSGQALFDANCKVCHGKYAAGSNMGPTLIHKIYQPGHHSDGSFYLAAKNGTRQHHWQFGSMPPIQTVTPKDAAHIVKYVRAIQRANGIN